MKDIIIKNGTIINEGHRIEGDLRISKGRIAKIGGIIDQPGCMEIDATDLWVIPGIIDDQVHFREPGPTHKATIYTESRAAIAGGVTSFMEMPNTRPAALTQELLQDKYDIAQQSSLANYSFYMGVSNDNAEEVLQTDPATVCGIKIFMGSSTGNMLVDDEKTLQRLFSTSDILIATHCEDESTIRNNLKFYFNQYGDNIPFEYHPVIRNEKACYLSSSFAASLAKKHDTRLHILHISTAEELDLFDASIPLAQKRITSEVCVHHLHFDQGDYAALGALIKCNPAIKESRHKKALFKALLEDKLDVIATDHAPHTSAEKSNPYTSAPAGLPLVQHALMIMLDFYHHGRISAERMVEKMCHAPAICFGIRDRGFVREGYMADLAIVDPNASQTISKDNILYKCGWSPLEGQTMKGRVQSTIVNGYLVYNNGKFNESVKGQRLLFNR